MSNPNSQTPKTKQTDENTVKKIASLAMLSSNPDKAFLEKYSKELNDFLDYAKDFVEIETFDILPTDIIRTIGIEDLREDEPSSNPEEKERVRKNIIVGFSQKQQNLLSIPKKIVG